MEFLKKEFGSFLHSGKYWAKNTHNEDFSKLYDYPLSIESLNYYDDKLKNKILKEIKNLKITNKSFTKNFKEHITAQVGPTLTEMFFSNYPQKVWGVKTENITSEWAPKRIKFRRKIEPFFSGEYTAVGKYGTGSIYNLIKDKILKNGGKIFLNHAVKKFRKKILKSKK